MAEEKTSCDALGAAHKVLGSRPLLAAVLGGLDNAEDLCAAACVSHLWCEAASSDTIWKPVWMAERPPLRVNAKSGYKAATKTSVGRARAKEMFEAATGRGPIVGSHMLAAAEELAQEMGAMALRRGARKGPSRL